ncbi:Uncharacterized membrane protein [Noviherbaspirillum humi]|uniref:Uncharacterized membrane protein n=1 Tax=Noviherbaspirillum humi TaxID=1688639 RepID=A0A239KEI6_9BURK|nr:DUF2306 domain-containing protein [Noviherbaspirillum humi]SNT16581.1 Uncharacterized membrane protein [Noviherbaspirillum humi]
MATAPLSGIILFHALGAGGAILIGGAVLLMRRGTPRHRMLGRLWAACMFATALSSFFIRSDGHFSWIHGLSLYVLISITLAVAAIMRGKVSVHRRAMTGTYAGLAIAGLFTLMPQRVLGQMLWGALGLL